MGVCSVSRGVRHPSWLFSVACPQKQRAGTLASLHALAGRPLTSRGGGFEGRLCGTLNWGSRPWALSSSACVPGVCWVPGITRVPVCREPFNAPQVLTVSYQETQRLSFQTRYPRPGPAQISLEPQVPFREECEGKWPWWHCRSGPGCLPRPSQGHRSPPAQPGLPAPCGRCHGLPGATFTFS